MMLIKWDTKSVTTVTLAVITLLYKNQALYIKDKTEKQTNKVQILGLGCFMYRQLPNKKTAKIKCRQSF